MDTDRLHYFCTVAQTAHIHRAAELLGISPAALSKSIKQLEAEIGLKLLAPTGRGIAITDDGKAFAARAERWLGEWEALLAASQAKAHAQQTLRIGSFEVFTTHALGPMLRDHLGEADLILHELVPGQLEEALTERQVDLGITYLPIPHPELDFMKVTTLRMDVFVRQGALSEYTLKNVPFVVPVPPIRGAPSKVIGLDGWPDHLMSRTIRYRVTLMESALELCRQGLAAAFLPKFVVELHNGKVLENFRLQPLTAHLPLPGKFIQQPVYLVKRKVNQESALIRRIAKALRIVCGN